MTARVVMVLGTTSGAGKSFLATALCRFYAREGFRVAPFKAQNMSNNARVVSGGEMGSAQYFQALAAGCPPEVSMNPILLKPESETRSQCVVLGKVRPDLATIPWKSRGPILWPLIADALQTLMATHDVVVIEGAGSPTEINLMASDLVNLKVARASGAATLLICDIDRGGAFAHLYGTWHFMPEPDRRALRGFILNRFRGDSSLLEPGPEMIQAATGVPVLSVLPWWREHGLPEEDAVIALPRKGIRSLYRVFIVAYPAISNHDEFQSLHQQPGIDCIWVRDRSVLAGLQPHDWIILPGSKQTQGDLAWLKHMGLDVVIQHHAETGGVVLGICGGLQMLGMTLQDPLGVEQEGFSEGLGLLPLETTFEVEKTVSRATYRFDHLRGPWMPLSGLRVTGYEIHQGRTVMISGRESPELLPGSVYQNEAGNILGLYLHGLFESPEVLRVFFGLESRTLDDIFEGLADFLVEHGGRETWLSLLEPKP